MTLRPRRIWASPDALSPTTRTRTNAESRERRFARDTVAPRWNTGGTSSHEQRRCQVPSKVVNGVTDGRLASSGYQRPTDSARTVVEDGQSVLTRARTKAGRTGPGG